MRGKGGSQRLSARGIYLTPLRPFWPCGGQIICDTRKVADVDAASDLLTLRNATLIGIF